MAMSLNQNVLSLDSILEAVQEDDNIGLGPVPGENIMARERGVAFTEDGIAGNLDHVLIRVDAKVLASVAKFGQPVPSQPEPTTDLEDACLARH